MGAMVPYEPNTLPDLGSVQAKDMCKKYITLLSDDSAVSWIRTHGKRSTSDARLVAEIFRKGTSDRCGAENEAIHGYFQPGCTFKTDIPKMGPCQNDFRDKQGLKFSDPPTTSALVSMIPMPLPKSLNMSMSEQVDFLFDFAYRRGLPDCCKISFGLPVHIAGMAMAHLHATGRDIFRGWQVRTDTCDLDGDRVALHRRNGKIVCGVLNQDDYRLPNTAVFLVGVIPNVKP